MHVDEKQKQDCCQHWLSHRISREVDSLLPYGVQVSAVFSRVLGDAGDYFRKHDLSCNIPMASMCHLIFLKLHQEISSKMSFLAPMGVPRDSPKAAFGYSLADVSQKVDFLLIFDVIWGAFGRPCGHHFGAFGCIWPPCDGFCVCFWGVLLRDPVFAPFWVDFGCTLGGANIAQV